MCDSKLLEIVSFQEICEDAKCTRGILVEVDVMPRIGMESDFEALGASEVGSETRF